jgi:hypothetical protein
MKYITPKNNIPVNQNGTPIIIMAKSNPSERETAK